MASNDPYIEMNRRARAERYAKQLCALEALVARRIPTANLERMAAIARHAEETLCNNGHTRQQRETYLAAAFVKMLVGK